MNHQIIQQIAHILHSDLNDLYMAGFTKKGWLLHQAIINFYHEGVNHSSESGCSGPCDVCHGPKMVNLLYAAESVYRDLPPLSQEAKDYLESEFDKVDEIEESLIIKFCGIKNQYQK